MKSQLPFILLMNALFAATFPLGKYALAYTSPTFLTAVRMLMAGVLLLTYSAYVNRGVILKRRDIPLFLITTFFYIYLSFVPEFWALQYLSSIKTNLLWSAQPFIAAALGFVVAGERLTARKVAALLIGFAGLVPIIMAQDPGEFSVTHFFAFSLPELALFVAVFSTVYSWFLIKKLQDKRYPLTFINGITMSLGGLACLLTSLAQASATQPLYTDFWMVLLYGAALVIVSNIIAYGIYGFLLSRYSITFLSFSGFTCPVFGFIYSYFLGETIYPAYIIGCTLIIIGLYLFYQEE
jgi:drug/metabolite transporter (DMT)-like permease